MQAYTYILLASEQHVISIFPIFSDFASVNLMFGVSNGFSLGLAPVLLIPLLGYRTVIILGSIFFTLGPFLTRFTLDWGLGWVILTYGVVQGLGNMALISPYVVPMLYVRVCRPLEVGRRILKINSFVSGGFRRVAGPPWAAWSVAMA